MGMCKGCGVVYSALIMKDGYCQECKPELFIDTPEMQEELRKLKEQENDKKILNKKMNTRYIIIGVIMIICGLIIAYIQFTKPSDNVVKQIAAKYNIGPFGLNPSITDIEIIKNYEKDGKIYYVISYDKKVCEMPMLKVNSEWKALGITCTR